MWHSKRQIENLLERVRQLEEITSRVLADISALNSSMNSVRSDIKDASSMLFLERLEGLERRFAAFHSMMVTKSPMTKEDSLTKTGRTFKKLFGSSK